MKNKEFQEERKLSNKFLNCDLKPELITKEDILKAIKEFENKYGLISYISTKKILEWII